MKIEMPSSFYSKTPTKLIFLLLIVFIAEGAVLAQSTLNISISGIPSVLPSPYLSDFEQNVLNGTFQVHLNNESISPVNIRLEVVVLKDGNEIIKEISLPAEFEPGMNVLTPLPDYIEFSKTTNQLLNALPAEMEQSIIQAGVFPEGNYTIRMQVFEVGSNVAEGPAGNANFTVNYPQPATLITPADNSSVQVASPVFSWNPVNVPDGRSLKYHFLLVEMNEGQNPGDALASNPEHESVILTGNTSLPYTEEYSSLKPNSQYAWQVTTQDSDGELPFQNEGKSEVFTFIYKESDEKDITEAEEDDPVGIQNREVSVVLPDLEITDAQTPESVTPGAQVQVPATVTNTGDVAASPTDVILEIVGGRSGNTFTLGSDSLQVDLQPGESSSVEFEVEVMSTQWGGPVGNYNFVFITY